MTAGLLADTFHGRLADEDRAERQADGWAKLRANAPAPHARDIVLPTTVIADVDVTRHWLERAAAYVRTLLPKAPKRTKLRGSWTAPLSWPHNAK